MSLSKVWCTKTMIRVCLHQQLYRDLSLCCRIVDSVTASSRKQMLSAVKSRCALCLCKQLLTGCISGSSCAPSQCMPSFVETFVIHVILRLICCLCDCYKYRGDIHILSYQIVLPLLMSFVCVPRWHPSRLIAYLA